MKPSLAGPKRPQDRVLLEGVQKSFLDAVGPLTANRKPKNGDAANFANEGGATAIGNPANDITDTGVRVENAWRELQARRRRGRHRRDHVVHQYLQPGGHARRRSGRQESRSQGTEGASRG